MSLETERILLEGRIGKLERDKSKLILQADTYVMTLRMAASPAVDAEDLDVEKIVTIAGMLRDCVVRIHELNKEIKRLQNAL